MGTKNACKGASAPLLLHDILDAHLNTWYRQDYKLHTFQSDDSAF